MSESDPSLLEQRRESIHFMLQALSKPKQKLTALELEFLQEAEYWYNEYHDLSISSYELLVKIYNEKSAS